MIVGESLYVTISKSILSAYGLLRSLSFFVGCGVAHGIRCGQIHSFEQYLSVQAYLPDLMHGCAELQTKVGRRQPQYLVSLLC